MEKLGKKLKREQRVSKSGYPWIQFRRGARCLWRAGL